jgi:hypothetical protein
MFVCLFENILFYACSRIFLEYNKAREVMRIAVKRCIKMLDIDVRNNTVLHQQSLFPLLGKRRMSLCFNQEASGVFLPQVGMCAIPQTACNTPPQVDTSKYKSRGVKAAGKRRWRACTSLVCSRFLHVSFAKKSPAQFFSRQFDFACKNGTTYFCPANVHKNRRDQRTLYDHVALTTWDWLISGGDQERNGDRKSDKKKPDKKKPDTSKRENDKGLKKIKSPKRDGLAAFLQRS